MVRTLLYVVLDWVHTAYPLVQAAQWVDDLLIYLAGTFKLISEIQPRAVAGLVQGLTIRGLVVAPKSLIIASTHQLASQLKTKVALLGVPMRTGRVGPDLGVDQRCARPGPRPKAAT